MGVGSGRDENGRVVFELPDVDAESLAAWCEAYLGSPAESELFRKGHLACVIGTRLADGREVVVRVRPAAPRIAACIQVQRHLYESGYPCPLPLAGPALLGDYEATAESYKDNLRWHGDRLLVAYDWDSLIADSEAVIAGLAAASYLYPALATVTQTRDFLDIYATARGRPFSHGELRRCWAAGVWTRAFDAKQQHAAGQPVVSLTQDEARERIRRAGRG